MKEIDIILTYEREDDEEGTNQLYDAVIDGEVVGSMSIIIDTKSAYVESIGVHETHRNQGIGTQMLRFAADLSDVVYVAPDNEDAKRLYDRIGYEMREDRYDEYGFAIDQGFGVYEL